jgi:hypothetical protein
MLDEFNLEQQDAVWPRSFPGADLWVHAALIALGVGSTRLAV